ncbi:MAG TPA: hypothetical protein VGX49_11650 [Jatrophihabitans sp.]|jgi:hypothetical protein|nr:hypothetical protein [Jatrophihabitans sp.]
MTVLTIDYDGRRFSPSDGVAGEGDRVAMYRQHGNLLWGEFSGGQVRRGALTGNCTPDGTLDFAYCMVFEGGEIVSGRCHSTPTVLADGRIRLHEEWERYGAGGGRGVSSIEEIPPAGRQPEHSGKTEEA